MAHITGRFGVKISQDNYNCVSILQIKRYILLSCSQERRHLYVQYDVLSVNDGNSIPLLLLFKAHSKMVTFQMSSELRVSLGKFMHIQN